MSSTLLVSDAINSWLQVSQERLQLIHDAGRFYREKQDDESASSSESAQRDIFLSTCKENLQEIAQLSAKSTQLRSQDHQSPLNTAFENNRKFLADRNIQIAEIKQQSPNTSAESSNSASVTSQEVSQKCIPKDEKKVRRGIPENCLLVSVSAEEFAQVPKYQKNRMTLQQINAIVTKFNAILEDKYRLIKTAFKNLSKQEKDRVIAYREQESLGAKDQYFLLEEDFKGRLDTKEAQWMKQAVPILRHLRRIAQSRKGKAVIYTVLTH